MHTDRRVVRTAWMAVLAVAMGLAAVAGAAEPVLKHIPDGAMGFVVINNVEKTLNSVEGFMKEIGVGQMFGPQPGAEADTPPVTLLGMARGMLKLGEGFTASGGVAVVMLDPADFGIDVMEMLGMSPPPAVEEGKADEAKAPAKPRPIPPIVVLVAGTGVDKVFGAYEPKDNAGMWQIDMNGMPVFAMQIGGYIAAGPNKDAVLAIGKASKKPVAAGLDPAAMAVVNRGDLVLHLNVAKIAPLMAKLMPMLKQEMAGGRGRDKEMANMALGIYENLLKELKAVTVSLRLTGDGIALESFVAALPESAMGKNLTSQAGVRGGVQTINSLPSLPYGLAFGAASAANPAGTSSTLDMVDKFMKSEMLAKVPEELKARTRKFFVDNGGLFTGVQFVAGGPPAGAGVFGLAWVGKHSDAAKAGNIIPEIASLAEAYIKALVEDKDAQAVKFVVTKGAETVAGTSVSTLEIQSPKMAEMKEDEKAEMKKALGEDKFILRWAIVGDSLVVTLGGGQAMMTEALKAAGGKGPIPTAPGTALALKHLPGNPSTVVLFSAANTLDVVKAGMTVFGAPEETLAEVPKFLCQTPIAMGAQAMPNAAHCVLYIPTQLVKEAVPVFMKMASGHRPGRAARNRPGAEKEVQKDGGETAPAPAPMPE